MSSVAFQPHPPSQRLAMMPKSHFFTEVPSTLGGASPAPIGGGSCHRPLRLEPPGMGVSTESVVSDTEKSWQLEEARDCCAVDACGFHGLLQSEAMQRAVVSHSRPAKSSLLLDFISLHHGVEGARRSVGVCQRHVPPLMGVPATDVSPRRCRPRIRRRHIRPAAPRSRAPDGQPVSTAHATG